MYGLNVNGFTLDRRGGQFSTLCEVMKEVQADVFLGSEHNLDSDNTQVRSILFDTAHHHWQRSRSTIGTTPIALKMSTNRVDVASSASTISPVA